jgi:hypothetical protein
MEKPVGPMMITSPVKYSFLIPENKVPKTLFVKFGTFCRTNNATITVKLEIPGHDAQTWSLNAAILKDNAYHPFPITKQWQFPNQMSATITVHCHAKSQSNSVATFIDDEGDGTVIVGTKRVKGMLIFDFDFADDIDAIKENENKMLNADQIPGQSKRKRGRNDGVAGLVSAVCPQGPQAEQWEALLEQESYNCFKMVNSVQRASGEYVLMRLEKEFETITKDPDEIPPRNIENAIHQLRDCEGASYTCVDRYPSSILTYKKYISQENMYLTGRWGANRNYEVKYDGPKKSNIVVYTAVTEGYDRLFDDFEPEEGVDYICFAGGRMQKMKNWQAKGVRVVDADPIKTARMYKILAHRFFPEYERSIWIDGNFQIKGGLRELAEKPGPLVMMKHDLRDCVYEELQACIDLRKDSKDRMVKQINKYMREGYPHHNGLVMTGCIVRSHHDPLVVKTMEDWWKEVKLNSFRDQLSFNYSAWKNGITPALMSHEVLLVDNFHKAEHTRKKKAWQRK